MAQLDREKGRETWRKQIPIKRERKLKIIHSHQELVKSVKRMIYHDN